MCKSNLLSDKQYFRHFADGPREKCSKQNAFNYLRYLDQIHIILNPIFIPYTLLLTAFHIEFLFCLLLFLQYSNPRPSHSLPLNVWRSINSNSFAPPLQVPPSHPRGSSHDICPSWDPLDFGLTFRSSHCCCIFTQASNNLGLRRHCV
jgi:hypothetical protein